MRPFFLLLWLSNFWKPYPILNATFVGVFLLVIFVRNDSHRASAGLHESDLCIRQIKSHERKSLSVSISLAQRETKKRKKERRTAVFSSKDNVHPLFALSLPPPHTHTPWVSLFCCLRPYLGGIATHIKCQQLSLRSSDQRSDAHAQESGERQLRHHARSLRLLRHDSRSRLSWGNPRGNA